MKFRLIRSKNYPSVCRAIALFATGTLLGAALMTISVAYRIDELILEKQNLQKELHNAQEENDNLRQIVEEKKRLQNLKVEKIEPVIIFPPETFTKYEEEALELELQNKIKVLLEDLKGKEIENLDYYLIPKIINGRHVSVLSRSLRLQIECIVIATKLTVYTRVVLVQDPGAGDI